MTEVVREVRADRKAFEVSYGYDIQAMVAVLHEIGVAWAERWSGSPGPIVIGPNLVLSRQMDYYRKMRRALERCLGVRTWRKIRVWIIR